MIGGLAQMPYAVCLTMRVVNCRPPAPDEKGVVRTLAPYHIRVLILCSGAAGRGVQDGHGGPVRHRPRQLPAHGVPAGRRARPRKRKFIHSLRVPNAVYVSGRKRAPAE